MKNSHFFCPSHVFNSLFSPSQHWIRIELYPDLLIQRLTMTVDPSDSSYMPSVVVISAGDSMQTLKEIKTVHINATDSLVTLLEDAQDVGSFSSYDCVNFS